MTAEHNITFKYNTNAEDTFEGWIPTFTVAPFTFSRWIRSM